MTEAKIHKVKTVLGRTLPNEGGTLPHTIKNLASPHIGSNDFAFIEEVYFINLIAVDKIGVSILKFIYVKLCTHTLFSFSVSGQVATVEPTASNRLWCEYSSRFAISRYKGLQEYINAAHRHQYCLE